MHDLGEAKATRSIKAFKNDLSSTKEVQYDTVYVECNEKLANKKQRKGAFTEGVLETSTTDLTVF